MRTFSIRALTALVAVALVVGYASAAFAHVANQKTQFPDIAGDPNAADILLLVALNIVPQTPVFEPEATFTRRDLAAWAALAHRQAQGGEGPDLAQLVNKGKAYVPSLDGRATAADIDQAIFDGKLALDQPDATFTKSEAARFVAAHLTSDFVRKLGYAPGPAGVVTGVRVGQSPDGDPSYALVIDGHDYAVDEHPRVVGPTDLTLWKGQTVIRSYLAVSSEGEAIKFAELGQPSETTPSEAGSTSETGPAGSESAPAATAPASPGPSAPWGWIVGLAGLLVVLGAVLFARRRA
ncbi:MAG: hypothetical protein IRZ18_09355 [Clostridia bacterium]|nr:hypothetical protein [Clostridia bacterium]